MINDGSQQLHDHQQDHDPHPPRTVHIGIGQRLISDYAMPLGDRGRDRALGTGHRVRRWRCALGQDDVNLSGELVDPAHEIVRF